MKQFFLGLVIGALIIGGLSFWIDEDASPVVTEICAPKVIETKSAAPICPTSEQNVDTQKIEKAFLLFLASIGIKNAQKYGADINEVVNAPEEYQPELIKEEETKQLPSAEIAFFFNEEEAKKIILNNEYIRDRIDYEPGLKKTATYLLRDPAVYFARSKLITKYSKLKRLNGNFTGKLYRMTGKHKGKVEDIELSIDYWPKDDKKIDGKFTMKIAREGEVYSHARGEGSNNDIYLNPNNPKQLIIKGAPGMYFHFESMVVKYANVYDEGEFLGVSTFTRL
tara:strand:- start:6509 stop:7351 length:843 start_codon:yes stop_codon:yes gene_type:complete